MAHEEPRPNLLIEQARRGNAAARGALLELYRNYLRLVARSLIGGALRTRLDASDLVQETFLKAHRDFEQFVGMSERELLAWLRQVLVRSLSNQVKHHRRLSRDHHRQVSLEQLLDQSSVAVQQALASRFPSPSEAAGRRERSVLLADAIDQLPPDYRKAFVLRTLEHHSLEEVAIRMERSTSAVRMLWVRAVKRLNEMLAEEP